MLLIAGDCRSVIYKFPFIYGTVQRHFLPLIFVGIGSSQAPFSSSEGFLNLTSNLRRYSLFLIDFPLLFIAESQDSLYCLIRRVASTPRIVCNRELQMYELCAETQRVKIPRIV